MAEREAILAKREEFLKEQNLKTDSISKTEELKMEIGALENKILSLQQVRQDLMNKQLAELENFGNMGNQQTMTGQRSLFDYFTAGGQSP
jgi:hypothetical protein